MGTMFDKKAKIASDSSTTKSDTKVIVVNDPKFEKQLQKLAELKVQSDAIAAQMTLVKDELNPMGLKIFNEEYLKTGKYPGSFNVQTKSGASGMFTPVDKYTVKLTKETFAYLQDKYDGLVDDDTEFGLNSDVLNQDGVGEKVEKALVKALGQQMTDLLITAKSVKKVKKGSIEKALTVGKGKSGKVTIDEFWNDISPTHYFKDPRKG